MQLLILYKCTSWCSIDQLINLVLLLHIFSPRILRLLLVFRVLADIADGRHGIGAKVLGVGVHVAVKMEEKNCHDY